MQFTVISPDDYPRLAGFFFNQKYRLSAYSLSSIVVWSNHIYESRYVVDGDTLIVANHHHLRSQDSYLLLPISSWREFTPAELCNILREAKLDKFWYVPADYLERFGRKEIESYFRVTEQLELNEYLYYTEDLVRLKGNRYVGKRNWINRFRREYGERAQVEAITSQSIGECLEFLEEWCRDYACTPEQNEGLYCEKQATICALKAKDKLALEGILVRIDGAVVAFGICSGLTSDIGVLSFEKAAAKIKGLYQFLDNECAKRLFTSYRFINKESDMGLPGLAQSKQSYHPIEIIKSYCLTLL